MHKNALAPTSKFNFVGQPYSDSNTLTFQVLSKCAFLQMAAGKVLMQGKLIAVVYTLRTY